MKKLHDSFPFKVTAHLPTGVSKNLVDIVAPGKGNATERVQPSTGHALVHIISVGLHVRKPLLRWLQLLKFIAVLCFDH